MSSDDSVFMPDEEDEVPLAALPSDDDGEEEEACSGASSDESSEEESERCRFGWRIWELRTLFTRLRRTIPRKDWLPARARAQKIDWGRVAFGDHTPEECQDVWMKVHEQMREHRTLSDVLQEMKSAVHAGTFVTRYVSHPDKPAPPKSAYALFERDMTQEIRQSQPHIDSRKLMRKLAERYKALSDDERQKYVDMAEQSSREYHANKAKFMRKHPEYQHRSEEVKKIKIVSKSVVDNSLVKTPFNIYLGVQRKKHGELSKEEELQFLEECNRSWKALDDDERMFWINWAEERFIVYKEEHPMDRKVSLRSILSRPEMNLRNKHNNKPADMPYTGISLFSKRLLSNEQVKKLNLPFADSMEFARLCWYKLKEKDRAEFRQNVEDTKKRYIEERSEYIENLPSCEKFIELHRPFEIKGLGCVDLADDVPAGRRLQKTRKRKGKQATQKREPRLPENTIEEYYSNLQKLRMRTSTWEECPKKERRVHMKNWLEKKHNYIVEYKEFLESLNRKELQEYMRNMNAGQEDEEEEEEEDEEREEEEVEEKSDSSSSPSEDSDVEMPSEEDSSE